MKKLEEWISAENFNDDDLKEIRKIADYPETTNKMAENRNIVENELKIKGIPTIIYDGKKHTGLYK